MCRCGTLGCDLVGMVLLGGWLDLMILEVFSNLWFCDLQTCWGCTWYHCLCHKWKN